MNYIGSKYSLLDFLQTTIDDVTGFSDGKGYVFADLFAGTGVVGATYKKRGYRVISNDIQYYSYVLNKHLIENVPVIQSEQLLSRMNSLRGINGFIFNHYCQGSGSERNYFEDNNGRLCDAIRTELEKLHDTDRIDDVLYYYFLASLINSIDKYANTASVYGAFLKHLKKSAAKAFTLELLPVIDGPKGKVYNEDINELARKVSGDILYLDPPYNARQYCANYHVLETIARYDNPVLTGKTGLRDYSRQKSEFCSRRTVASVFDDLIANAKFKYIFLSYNNEGLMGLDTIREIMSRYGKYEMFTQNYRRFKADRSENRNIAAEYTTEYLHCVIKS